MHYYIDSLIHTVYKNVPSAATALALGTSWAYPGLIRETVFISWDPGEPKRGSLP